MIFSWLEGRFVDNIGKLDFGTISVQSRLGFVAALASVVLEHWCVDKFGVRDFLRLGSVVRVHSEYPVLTGFLDEALLVTRRGLDCPDGVTFELELLLVDSCQVGLRITVLRVQIHTVLLLFWDSLE